MRRITGVYGSRGRIGLIVPANNAVIEPEIYSVMPAGLAAYATRILARGDLTPEAVRLMESEVDAALDRIAATGVDVIAYCDMVTTFIMEPGWNEAAVAQLSAHAGTPVISAWTALRDALAAVGARRIALGTPYPRTIHALAPPFFRQRGIDVTSDATLDIAAMHEVPAVTHERLMQLVAALDPTQCDAVVLLATDLPTFGSIADIEHTTRRPVLTSNQTILWSALGAVGSRAGVGLGRLFEI